jgi:hypothetical protein
LALAEEGQQDVAREGLSFQLEQDYDFPRRNSLEIAMKGKSIVKASVGGFVGLILGTIAGCYAVFRIVSRDFPPVPPGEVVGIDVRVYLHSFVFWFIALACTLGLGFLATRIGHRTHHRAL